MLWILSHRPPQAPHLRPPDARSSPRKPVASGMMSLLSAFESLSGDYQVKWFATQCAPPTERTSNQPCPSSTQLLDLPAEQLQRHTQFFCNQTLWPLCHQIFEKPRYQRADWEAYDDINRRVAELLHRQDEKEKLKATLNSSKVRVLIQDYHFARVGHWLKKLGFNGTYSLFWHIPWPSWEAFRTLPWAQLLLESLQSFQVVGFHTPEDVDRYHRCLSHALGTAGQRNGTHLPAGSAPLISRPQTRARRPHGTHARGRTFLLGVDRADFTKGLLERIQAIELLLEKRPELQKNLTLIQIACPTRHELENYQRLAEEIRTRVRLTNQRFQHIRPKSRPLIHLIEKVLSKKAMAELHLKTDVMLVTPLHDGMNLVAKEHVLTRAIDPTHGPSTLVLSQFAGAIHELPEAIAVNPFSPESICDGIEAALALSKEEKSDRLRKMSFRLRQWTQEDWARRLVELTEKAPESSLSKEHRPYATLQA